MKNKLVLSIVSMFMSLLLCVGAVFAWFGSADIGNTYYYGYSGTMDAATQLYMGKDDDFNGTLNDTSEDISTRQGMLANQYVTIQQALLDTESGIEGYFQDIYPGKQLTYKLVFQNKSQKRISVDLSFGNMQMAFYDALTYYLADTQRSLTSATLKNYYSENSAKLLFALTGMQYTIYAQDAPTDDLDTGFNTAVSASSNIADSNLWQHANGQSFAGQQVDAQGYDLSQLIVVPAGNLVEIDFKIVCTQNSQSIDQYISSSVSLYYQNYLNINTSALATYGENEIKTAISTLAAAERSFIYSRDEGSGDAGFYTGTMEFEIPYIQVCGTLLEGN